MMAKVQPKALSTEEASTKIKTSRLEHWCFVPLYYFEPEGPGWDYQDDDGIELPNDAEALAYAREMIRELKEDGEIIADITHLLVKDRSRKTIFRIAFE